MTRRLSRTRFGDIVAEFLQPRLPPRRRGAARTNAKVIVYCPGVPGSPSKSSLANFFADKGYWFFAPRYRGSWESFGKFLKFSPDKDVLRVIDGLSKGFTDVYTGKNYRLRGPKKIFLMGASFGGPAVILASRDRRVTKAVAASPVIDWRAPSKTEPFPRFVRMLKEGFGGAYRGSHADVRKLQKGNFYSPWAAMKTIRGEKLLLFHAKNDLVVSFRPTATFAKKTGAGFIALRRGGHFGSAFFTQRSVWKKIKKFFDQQKTGA